MDFLTSMYQDNEIWRWLLALGILLFAGFALRIILRVTVRRLRAIVIKTPGRFDDLLVDLLQKTRFLFIFVVSVYAAALILTLPTWAESALQGVFVVAFLFQVGYWGNAFVEFWIRRSVKRRLEEDAATATTMSALGFVAKMVIWSIVILVTLDIYMDVTAIIAGLGIGGIAIALAVQNILSDLFASISIIVDKPFGGMSRKLGSRQPACAVSLASRLSSLTATCCQVVCATTSVCTNGASLSQSA